MSQKPEVKARPTAAASSPAPASPLVSIIIVVWNAKRYVLECLESLREHGVTICTEVIVVDNASTDGTPDLIAQRFPQFTLIRNPENYGFARANNIGIAASSGDYLCLVNSDVKFTRDCISPMLQYLGENPEVALLGPRMLGPNGEVRRSTMRFPTLWNTFCRAIGLDTLFPHSRRFGGLLMSDFDHNQTAPVEVLNGWFWLVRRTAIARVGLLDPIFFMYGEDVDWCYRFHHAGEKTVFFAGAEAIHYGGASSSNAPLRFYLEQSYANWQFWRKHHGWLPQMAFLATLAVHNLIRFLGAAAGYLLSPSQRPLNLLKLKGSLVCLQWVTQPNRISRA